MPHNPPIIPQAHLGISPPLRGPVYFCLFNIVWTYVASVLTGNASQVDRIWTFLPTIYTTWYTFFPTFESAPASYSVRGISDRAYLMWGLNMIWMWRLSYNAWRRNMFALNEEDYRWPLIRAKIPKALYQVFNLGFVSIIQNILLFMLSLPAYNALENPTPLGISDYVITVLTLISTVIEFTADNQQYSYQNFKSSGVINPNEWPGANIQWNENDRKRGFVTKGLWAWSRHPNFACEQTFWILFSCFPIFASPKLDKLSPSDLTPLTPLISSLSLCMLFFSSTLFTEAVTKKKYTMAYTAYQQRVGMFVPFLGGVNGYYLRLRYGKETLKEIDELVWGNPNSKKLE